jgi:hypothetical protein
VIEATDSDVLQSNFHDFYWKDILFQLFHCSVNIVDDSANYLLHVDFRPFSDAIILNNKMNGRWGRETWYEPSKQHFVAVP